MEQPIPSDAELMRRCRDRGLKATPQRLAVYRALLGTTEHPSPEALHRRVVAELPSLALGTVYKILDSLERVGLVEQVSLLAETKRYDANRAPHQHLVCKVCKDVVDYVDPVLDVSPARLPAGFVPLEVRVQVIGVCVRCHAS